MGYVPTSNDLQLILQRQKSTYIKLEILNQSFERLRTITGDTISSSFNIDMNSAITRTCSLSIIVKSDDLIVGNPNSKIWINTFVRVFRGIKNEITNKMKTIFLLFIFIVIKLLISFFFHLQKFLRHLSYKIYKN